MTPGGYHPHTPPLYDRSNNLPNLCSLNTEVNKPWGSLSRGIAGREAGGPTYDPGGVPTSYTSPYDRSKNLSNLSFLDKEINKPWGVLPGGIEAVLFGTGKGPTYDPRGGPTSYTPPRTIDPKTFQIYVF